MQQHHLLLFAATTGYQTRMFAEAARRLGVRCTLATDRCDHLTDPWGDGAIPVRFERVMDSLEELTTAQAERGPFTAVAAVGDRPALLAAMFAERAGLRFHPPHAVEAAGNKFLLKERFRAAGLLQPQYRRWPIDDASAEPFVFPCVLKPLGLSGSRGVIRTDDAAQFTAAFHRIGQLLREDKDIRRRGEERDRWIQCEEFIPGEEFALEGIVTEGNLQVLAIFDKPDPLNGPYFEETIYVTPSAAAADVQERIRETVERGVAALGLTDGPVHAEVRLNERGVWILEIAPRPIGGYCARALRFGEGVGLEELVVRHALEGAAAGPWQRTADASGVLMIPIPKAGIYRGVEGVEQAEAVPGIERVLISAIEGQNLKAYPEASSYLGFVFAQGADPADVTDALRKAHNCLRFEIATTLETV
jgi:biotin carboxylase